MPHVMGLEILLFSLLARHFGPLATHSNCGKSLVYQKGFHISVE